MTQTLYAVVVVDENDRQMIETYKDKMTAMIEINKMDYNVKLLKIENFEVYLTEVEYNKETGGILDDKWINETSELKIKC
ncbi:hypothetical protein BUZ69_12655 [Staphylococcus saprophyticus]|uniref:hypothetical protein n=1 Tax=Staphylococcus saprophyticus TaxID=29385 RepID=UPI000D1E609D|nr:hypothetical protein [Staphylococcus saprophyticus]PTK44878.1 hypothetical protein BUZ69_12655 [Staphylococcus saprophyticus]